MADFLENCTYMRRVPIFSLSLDRKHSYFPTMPNYALIELVTERFIGKKS